MFTKLPDKWGASSSEGFTVTRSGSPVTQFVIEYSEGERALRYCLESLVQGSVQPITASNIGPWLRPHEAEVIGSIEQREIANRIVKAMVFLGEKFAVA
jgi:hypothetical protein